MSHRDSERTSRTTIAREYISDSFVFPIVLCVGSESSPDTDSCSGAIHLKDPTLSMEYSYGGDTVYPIIVTNSKSCRTAFLSLLMRMFGYPYHE